MISNILDPQPYLTVFPDNQSVFAEPVEKYSEHIHPLVTIDLGSINPAFAKFGWNAKVHLVSPVEPSDGHLGQYSQTYHNDYLKPNWLAFSLDKLNRYHLLGDFRFFFLECDKPDPQVRAEYLAQLSTHYDLSHKDFIEAKARFGLYKKLLYDDSVEQRAYPRRILEQLGGDALADNWTFTALESGVQMNRGTHTYLTRSWLGESVYPISSRGNRFYFIASVPAYSYVKHSCGADSIMLFYEPIESIVWLTFDYS
jgi:hypothetical protein